MQGFQSAQPIPALGEVPAVLAPSTQGLNIRDAGVFTVGPGDSEFHPAVAPFLPTHEGCREKQKRGQRDGAFELHRSLLGEEAREAAC